MSNIIKTHVISTGSALITSPFGQRVIGGKSEHHDGIDLVDANRLERTRDVDILCFADGKVVMFGLGNSVGNYVDVLHEGKFLTRYFHMKRMYNGKAGQSVKKGDILGIMGTTGNSTGIHLHFGLKENSTYYNNGSYVNPLPYLLGEKTIGNSVTTSSSVVIKIGDRVKLVDRAMTYATGQTIPSWVKGNIHTVQQLTDNGNKILLKEIMSWVWAKDLTKI